MNQVETLLGIFTVDKGKVKILLVHKKDEPYKGYWVLPNKKLSKNSIEENIEIQNDDLGLKEVSTFQCHTFNFKEEKSNVISIAYLGLIDSITLVLKKEERNIELQWFDIDSIPKTGYEHDKVTEKLLEFLKIKIINSNILQILFPSDFTLPELQKIYEQVLNIKLDRRNFRKKMLNLGFIIDTNDVNEGATGRPAKLYRFSEEIEEKNIL